MQVTGGRKARTAVATARLTDRTNCTIARQQHYLTVQIAQSWSVHAIFWGDVYLLHLTQHEPPIAPLLREFLTACSSTIYPIGVNQPRTINSDTINIVMQRSRCWDFGVPSHVAHKYLTLGLEIATTAYHHITSPDVQADIATYSGLCVMFDDEIMGLRPMEMFSQRFHANAPQLHPSLDRLAEVIRDIGKHFPPFSANAIVISTLDFINAELLLKSTSTMPLVPGSSNYIKYMRTKDGIDEAFAAFIFPLYSFPDTLVYIQAFP